MKFWENVGKRYTCPVCEAPVDDNATYCPACDSELTGMDLVARRPNYYSLFLMPITNFAYNFLGVYVLILFLFTFFFDLSEPGSIASLTPNIIIMARIKWMFISMIIAGSDMYLHSRKRKKYLLYSFVPSLLMIIGLAIALYRFEYAIGEMLVIGFMFIILIIMFYFDFMIFIHYPKEADEKSYASFIRDGEFKYISGHYEMALQFFNKALSLTSRKVEAWNGKGKTLLKMRKIPEAVACFDKAINIDEGNAEAWFRKGQSYVYDGKYPAAVHFFEKATVVDEDYVDAWMELGSAYLKLEQLTEAKFCFDRVIQIDPNNSKAWNFRGKTLFNSGTSETTVPDSLDSSRVLRKGSAISPLSSLSAEFQNSTETSPSPMGSMRLKELLPSLDEDADDEPIFLQSSSDELDSLVNSIQETESERGDFDDDSQEDTSDFEDIDESYIEDVPMNEEYQTEDMPEDEDISQNEDDELFDSYIEGQENEPLIDDIESHPEDVFFCPKCSHIISKNTPRCPKCGNQFSDVFEDELDELIHSNLDEGILEDDIVLTENDLSSMEDNLEKFAKNKPETRKAVRECIVCGAMLFEGHKICPVCGESTGVE